MDLHKHLVRSLIYPASRWKAGETAELRYLREFEQSQFWPEEKLRALQLARLQKLLRHAYDHCPFYRDRFQQAAITPSEVRHLDDLANFPILEKQDIQEQRDRLVTENWPKDDLVPNRTSGSTGCPMSFFLSNERKCSRAAATIRHNRWAGLDVGTKTALIWGAPQDLPAGNWRRRLRNLLLDRQLFLDCGHVTDQKLHDFHHALLRFQPKVILAYARAAVLFARFLQAQRLTPYRPASIITSAEVLDPADRALLESVFGCSVFNRYGCREVSVIATECNQHQGLHTMAEGLFIEIVRGEEPARPDELGAVLVTDLLNYAMPLIRYRIGDLAAWDEGSCPCGRGLPRLKQVTGRVSDFLVGHDGRLVSGIFLTLYLIAQRPSLGQVQIVQHRAGEVLFRIKPGKAFQQVEDLTYLEKTCRRYVGETTRVEWEFVDELKSEPSGKFLFCRSTVSRLDTASVI